ncbi:hypothetical protein [Plantactinospora sp. WMMB782]|uniref:hypothetical protein n=1 Tax=Plantactinospora sp. WMMB782 TaxID=3404121 RepID=UPI003B928544
MEITVRVCDVCTDPTRAVTTYTVTDQDGRSGSTDRCEVDGESLATIIAATRAVAPKVASSARTEGKKPGKKATAPRRRRQTEVMTLEQIEEMKRKE